MDKDPLPGDPEYSVDIDHPPGESKNAKKKRRRRGISGTTSEVNENSKDNSDVDDIPNVKVKEPDVARSARDSNGKAKAGAKKKEEARTRETSRFFGIIPTEGEVSSMVEYLTMAQGMMGCPPVIVAGFNPDSTPILKDMRVANFKTTVYEMNEENVIKKKDVTYAYVMAKMSAIMSGGVVNRMEDFCENNPFVSAIGICAINAFSFSMQVNQMKVIVEKTAQQVRRNAAQQNIPINNDGEVIEVKPIEQ